MSEPDPSSAHAPTEPEANVSAPKEPAQSDPTPCEACVSPPLAERSPQRSTDPRDELLRLAGELVRGRDARLLNDYLRLRRATAARR